MFQTLAASPAHPASYRLPLTLMAATIVHAALVTALMVFPLLFPNRVPDSLSQLLIVLPQGDMVFPPAAPPVAASPGDVPPRGCPVAPPDLKPGVMYTPVEIADTISPDTDIGDLIVQAGAGAPGPAIPGGVPGAGTVSPGYGLPGMAPTVGGYHPPEPPPPPPRQPAVRRAPLPPRVLAARALRAEPPAYPVIAQASRTEGDVELKVTVDEHGRVTEVTVLGGHPLLVPAAVAAVRGWVYQPTRINDQPVPVEGYIVVKFRLGRR